MGRKLNTDLTIENKGSVPVEDYYNRIYGARHWSALTVRSLAIGQGELGITPLQLANYCAAVANRGYYYIPHVVKEIEDEQIDSRFNTKNENGIIAEYFEPVIKGMQMVVENTNAAYMIRIPGITCAEKQERQKIHMVTTIQYLWLLHQKTNLKLQFRFMLKMVFREHVMQPLLPACWWKNT